MAGIGIGPDDFEIFAIADPDERCRAVESRLQPKLLALGRELSGGLSRVVGRELCSQYGKLSRRRGTAPDEAFVAFAESTKTLRGVPYLALSVTRGQLHARVAVRGECERATDMRRAVEREASSLARKGKPFRKLRHYIGWNYEELPEVAPATSPAFWQEIAEELAPSAPGRMSGADLGIAWSREEARSLSVGDVLGAFRDIAPLYKLLVNA
ncbi:MAG TPA: DUF1054 family protein [Anaeromyxobacteraceae bacterium]|nr:DUF1054 family protein [Anaeromyxobacteraceae bacterium]